MAELERQAKEAMKAAVIPPFVPPMPEELERRSAIAARIDQFREKIGLVPFSVADLIREDRESR